MSILVTGAQIPIVERDSLLVVKQNSNGNIVTGNRLPVGVYYSEQNKWNSLMDVLAPAITQLIPSVLPPSGTAGGDLTGTYPNPTIGGHKVTLAKMQQISSKKLLGNPATSLGNVTEITVGSGLSLSNGGVLSASGSSGSVTNVAVNDLSPLFTVGVATPTTTPVITFTPVSQSANLFYASPDGSAGNPSFRAIVAADIPTLIQYELIANKNAPSGYVGLDGSSKINSIYLPAIAITDTFVVGSQVAMLALTAETGDVAIRTDLNKSFILQGTNPSVLGDWQELLTPTDTVLSVNGFTGVVSLTTTDIPEGSNLYYTSTRFNTAFAAKTTSDLAEGSNLYFTNGRAVTALTGQNISIFVNDSAFISLTAISATSPITYNNTTGVISTSMATNKLIGRSTAGTGVFEEITLGAGLSYTGTTLNCTITGTVTSVNASGGSTGFSFTGGPITTSGTLTLTGTLDVDNGGTGQTSHVAYSPIFAGSTSTNPFQSFSLGASGTVLTSTGTGSLPSWQAPASSGASSVSNSDGTLTISPTTGAVVASLNLAHSNTWTANQHFTTTVTTGTGTSAGMNILANSLTTGNGIDVSSSTVSSGTILLVTSTSTAAASNTQTGIKSSITGLPVSVSQQSQAIWGSNTIVGNNTATRIGIRGEASGGSAYAGGGYGYGGYFTSNIIGQGTYGVYASATGNCNGNIYGGYFTASSNSNGPANYGIYANSLALGNSTINYAVYGNVVNAAPTQGLVSYGVYSNINVTNNYSGANYGGYFSSVGGAGPNGTTLTSYGVYITATGAVTNYGLIVAAGSAGIGTVTPTATRLEIVDNTLTTGTEVLVSTSSITTGSVMKLVSTSNASTGTKMLDISLTQTASANLSTSYGIKCVTSLTSNLNSATTSMYAGYFSNTFTAVGSAQAYTGGGLYVEMVGTVAGGGVATYGAYISNTCTQTGSPNYGIYVNATGGTNSSTPSYGGYFVHTNPTNGCPSTAVKGLANGSTSASINNGGWFTAQGGAGTATSYGIKAEALSTAGVNTAGYFDATGGSSNYGIVVNRGSSGFGITTPTSLVHIKGTGSTSSTSSLNIVNSSSTDIFFVRDDGKIGVGTSSPSAVSKFHISGIAYNSAGAIVVSGTSTDTVPGQDYAALNLVNTTVQNNNYNTIAFSGSDGIGNYSMMIVGRYVDQTNHYGELSFWTRGAGGSGQRLVIDKTGQIGVGGFTTGILPTALFHIYQPVTTTGSPKMMFLEGGAHTTLTASVEASDAYFSLARTVQFSTGALTIQRAFKITSPTYGFVGASTITDAANFGIIGAPVVGTNATITNTHALLISTASVGSATSSYGLTVNAMSGATNNYAAQFLGGNVGIGTSTPVKTLEVSGDFSLKTAGNGIYIKEGSNATMGIATLVGGTVTISNTKITANSRVFLATNGGTLTNLGSPYEDKANRIAGTSFVIKSSNALDTSDVAWIIIEPN